MANYNAKKKLEALKKAGVNTDNLFAMSGKVDVDILARLVDGRLEVVPDDDEIFNSIMAEGTLENKRLFRRWVMSQMFHAFSEINRGWYKNFTEYVHRKGYNYSWEMIENEFKAMSKMTRNSDWESLNARTQWWNGRILESMVSHDIATTLGYINKLKVKHYHHKPYKTIRGKGHVLLEDIYSKILAPLEKIRADLHEKGDTVSAYDLYDFVKKYNKIRIRHSWRTKQCADWVDSYKGAGSYYTLQNLFLFHDCEFNGLKGENALKAVDDYVTASGCGYMVLGYLKKVIAANNIDIDAEIKSWRK